MPGLKTLCSHCRVRDGVITFARRASDVEPVHAGSLPVPAGATGFLCGPCAEKTPPCVSCHALVVDVGFQVKWHGRSGWLCKACARASIPTLP